MLKLELARLLTVTAEIAIELFVLSFVISVIVAVVGRRPETPWVPEWPLGFYG